MDKHRLKNQTENTALNINSDNASVDEYYMENGK